MARLSLWTTILLSWISPYATSWQLGATPLQMDRVPSQRKTTRCVSALCSSQQDTPLTATLAALESILDRRSAISATLLGTFVLGATHPARAAYIDPSTDPPKVTDRVYLDVSIGDSDNPSSTQRIVIDLFGELMPRMVDHFGRLFESNAYAGTTFYRVLSDFSIQGGAIGDATGQTAGDFATLVEPDNYNLKHSKTGLISGVRGPTGLVDSRFFINCNDNGGWGDERYAVFGGVQDASLPIVKKIEQVPVARPKNKPKKDVKIVASGRLRL